MQMTIYTMEQDMQSNQSEHRDRKHNPGKQPTSDENTSAPPNTGFAPGHPVDEVGGPGLAKAPGEGHQPPEKKAPDPQDRKRGGA